MRDIRKDLRERLGDIASEKAGLKKRLDQLSATETMLTALLEQEEVNWRARQPSLLALGANESQSKVRSPLTKFILDALSDRNPHRLVDLVAIAQRDGITVKSKYPRRAIHFALVGLKQNGLVEMVESGVWRIGS